ncbi:hypothetical protein BD410DRAFT_788738 [Rickenella mellea]|uniref:F-box domain-containing protein n=1 Tax=Rickenella mellea TaxID=50990 RepID=A0A4Y7Q6F1_9AGAM|nr:hypothetical protein BD410DRAFT_788738 [Rickenella mellea]
MVALNDVRDHLGKRIRFLRKAHTPFLLEEGIKSLPDEVLSHIFEAGHYITDDCSFAKRVSQVSHRFRQVSLRLPLLWTRLLGEYSKDQIALFVLRSGQMDLDISLYSYDSRVHDHLEILGPHSNRWSHLRVYSEEAENAMQYIGLTELPNLRVLYNHCPIELTSWKLPRLTQIQGYGCNLPPEFIAQQLTTFEFSTSQPDESFDIKPLAQAIYSMKNLRNLSVTLKRCREASSDLNIEDLKTPSRHSVFIDTLHVTIKDCTTYAVVEPLYHALSHLSASTVNFTLEDLTDMDIPTRCTYLSTGRGNISMFPHGSTINIRILRLENPYPIRYRPSLLAVLVQDCDIANTIHIEARSNTTFISHYEAIEWKYFSALRHLRFTHCDELSEMELHALVTNLMIGAEPGKGLQSLEVIECRGISEECLLDLADNVGSKLTWKL